jgi:hypothetical protein
MLHQYFLVTPDFLLRQYTWKGNLAAGGFALLYASKELGRQQILINKFVCK